MALVAPDASPWPRDTLDLRRPSLLAEVGTPGVRLGWVWEDVIRWREEGVESGKVGSESASLKIVTPVGSGAVGIDVGRGWSYATYAADRAAELKWPREYVGAAYGWRAAGGIKLGVLVEQCHSDAKAAGTYLGDLLNSTPSGRLDLPLKVRTLTLEGRADHPGGEVGIHLDLLDTSLPATLINGDDTASLDLGHNGLGWGMEAFQQVNPRLRLCVFGGTGDRSGAGEIAYNRRGYGEAETGVYDTAVAIGAQWDSDARTVAWGELLYQRVSLSGHGRTAVPGSLGLGVPGHEFRFVADAGLSARSIRLAAQHQRRDGILLGVGVQASEVDADSSWWSREAQLWGLIPVDVSATYESMDGARLYLVGMGARKQLGDTQVEVAVVKAFAEGPRKPPKPAPAYPPEKKAERHVGGGLAMGVSIARRW